MIIWINGAFGSGKTQTAHELHRRLPNSTIYDPENVGYFLRRKLPFRRHDDFQDYELWREINYSMLRYISREHEGTILVPMTVVVPRYFEEIVGRLRADGADVRHFALLASPDTLLRRLRSRGEGPNSWAARQIERCVASLSDDRFREHLETDRMTLEEVANAIASSAHLPLLPDRRSAAKKAYDRLATQFRHIRWIK
ncbi:AAA family ATPase [Cohnella caldifontis]|uniref:AAA family ATPase n=1 Tax=Cohnella caldifontis TaxID=3027471 RepID=UPI0023EAB567|nr:AAA family ATPase [Cohnella sp. YIM B05605]